MPRQNYFIKIHHQLSMFVIVIFMNFLRILFSGVSLFFRQFPILVGNMSMQQQEHSDIGPSKYVEFSA